jgi:pimeloyl-ACP methyl ester carboxylesterase
MHQAQEHQRDGHEGRLSIEGFQCRFQVSGTPSAAPPVFFVSGAFQTMESWRKFARHFETKTTVLLADLPGMGGSDLLPRTHGLDFLAKAARRILDAAQIENAYVVSASYGSPIAYRLAQLHPERVEHMVLAGVMQEIPSDLRALTAQTMRTLAEGRMSDFAREIVDGLLCRDAEKPIEKRRLAERLLTSQLEKLPLSDRERYIENTARLLNHAPLDLSRPPAAPTLVFTGEHDVYTRPSDCRRIAAALPDAAFTVIERADHLFHIERFDATLELLDRFFESGTELDELVDCAPFERFRDLESSPSSTPPTRERLGRTRIAA